MFEIITKYFKVVFILSIKNTSKYNQYTNTTLKYINSGQKERIYEQDEEKIEEPNLKFFRKIFLFN
mgnify:CR=1 FL=1